MSRVTTGIIVALAIILATLFIWKPWAFEPWAPGKSLVNLGLDLQGGLRLVLALDGPVADPEDAQERVRRVLENRINALGVAEPLVQNQGQDRIAIELPGLSAADQQRAIDLIGQQAVLEFRLVNPDAQGKLTRSAVEDLIRQEGLGGAAAEQRRQILSAQEMGAADLGPVLMTGEAIANARAERGQFGAWEVQMSFTGEGAIRFGQITGQNVGRLLAIVLDDVVISAPRIQQQILGGQAQITGRFSLDEANDLALVLRSGSLPVSIRVEEARQIGPTLGRDAIRFGTSAGIIGGALILLFLLAYYGPLFGGTAILGLGYTGTLIFGILSGLEATLTLPGIAGLVLTIGTAVDGNVITFERVKEELRAGRGIRSALSTGVSNSLSAILDANVTTLLAAAALYNYTTGPVRGFAVTLAVGIAAAMFSNLVFVPWLLENFTRYRRAFSPPQWIKDTRIAFLKAARFVTFGSLGLAVAGVIVIVAAGFNLGIDFTGGNAFLIRTAPGASVGEIRTTLDRTGIVEAAAARTVIQRVDTPLPDVEDYSIRTGLLTPEESLAVEEALRGLLGAYELIQAELVGPAVGADLANQTRLAIVVALALILLYVGLRFEPIFAIAATVAAAHDIAIVLGIVSFLQLEFTIPLVAAILTVAGYSLNDSIIVSDRIRENLKKVRLDSYREIVELAINQTLSRTLMTSFSTMLPLIALILVGGPVLRDFSITLLVGILIGTYSSVYIVAPSVAWFREWAAQRQGRRRPRRA
jgi:SecD/SecF fusion protein